MQVTLQNFDQAYFESLPRNETLYPPDKKSIYHTIIVDGEKAGIVGYVPLAGDPTIGFVQILLAEAFRGKGLVQIAEGLLVKKYGIKRLYATVKEENCASLKAHQKIGFTELPRAEIEKLRTQGYLHENETRLVKEFV